MLTINDVAQFLEEFAPLRLAADWDNVGLLVGSRQGLVERVMTCLTITPSSAAEAMREKVGLVVAHHPLPFHPLKRITDDTTPGRLLLSLIRHGIAVVSPHTAFDSAGRGINQQLAEKLGLAGIAPLIPEREAGPSPDRLGTGRIGEISPPISLRDLALRASAALQLPGIQVVGKESAQIGRVAIACGSAGELLEAGRRAGCQAFVTGEATFHTCLEAEAGGVQLLLLGHYASERFGVEALASILQTQFPLLNIWASRDEGDPLHWIESPRV